MSKVFEKNIIELLIPFTQFCYRRGLKIQQLVEMVKIALIRTAERDLLSRGDEVNVSRLSVATGLQRRDVMRLWQSKGDQKLSSNIITKVIGQWVSDKRFATGAGKPKVITFEGKESEFAELVASVSQDINPYTVLFELERSENVVRTPKGLKLKKAVFQPSDKDTASGLNLLTGDISDFIRAVEQNIFQPPTVPHLHIKTDYDNIPSDMLPEIKALVLSEGDAFQKRMRDYLSRFDRDINPTVKGRGRARVAVGTFSFTEELTSKKEKKS